jgi:transposase-like protein
MNFPPYRGSQAERRQLRHAAIRQIMTAPAKARPALWKQLAQEWEITRRTLSQWRRELGIFIERGPDSEAARQAVAAVRGGMHRYRAARLYGVSWPALKRACDRAGLAAPNGIKPELRAKAIELVNGPRKIPPAKIAEQLNVTPATVREWAKRARRPEAKQAAG